VSIYIREVRRQLAGVTSVVYSMQAVLGLGGGACIPWRTAAAAMQAAGKYLVERGILRLVL